jgi:hypothetical protein
MIMSLMNSPSVRLSSDLPENFAIRSSFARNTQVPPVPTLRLTREIIDIDRLARTEADQNSDISGQPPPLPFYTCPLEEVAMLMKDPSLTAEQKTELAIVIEAHEMYIWTMMDQYIMMFFSGMKARYLEGEILERHEIVDLYGHQNDLFPRRGDRHRCRMVHCGRKECLAGENSLPWCERTK